MMNTPLTRTLVLATAAILLAAHTAFAAGLTPTTPTKPTTPITPKKGGSGVELAYGMASTPEVGKPLTITIQMASPAEAQLAVRLDAGLQLNTPALVMRSAAGKQADHQMTITPLAPGRHYIYLSSTANGRTSASAIAVQVGKDMPLAKGTGVLITMPNGERVVSMPAQ